MRGLPKVLILFALCGPLVALGAEQGTREFQQQVEAMLEQGHADDAYRALNQHKSYAGQAWYDLLLGRAALESGHDEEAVRRLERYVGQNPQQDPPQFLLARAYLKTGQTDRAVAQYRRVLNSSPFEPSRDRARDELAKIGALPVIPVGEPRPPPVEARQQEFPEEKRGIAGEVYLGAGHDSNANSGADAERYFFYTLAPQQRSSESWYLDAGGTGEVALTLGDNVAWRNGVALSARSNPSAHFADTQDVSVQTQVRWSGPQQRFSVGVVQSASLIDERQSDEALALGTKLETLTRALLVSVSTEAARIRFPHVAERDVDTFFLRTEIAPAPDETALWSPTAAVTIGFEQETHEGSPFGRNVWGLDFGAGRRLGPRFSLDGEVGFLKSMYDEAPLTTERRTDDNVTAKLYLNFQPAKDSAWEHAFGARFRRNISTEGLYDFTRWVIGYEMTGTWGKKETP